MSPMTLYTPAHRFLRRQSFRSRRSGPMTANVGKTTAFYELEAIEIFKPVDRLCRACSGLLLAEVVAPGGGSTFFTPHCQSAPDFSPPLKMLAHVPRPIAWRSCTGAAPRARLRRAQRRQETARLPFRRCAGVADMRNTLRWAPWVAIAVALAVLHRSPEVNEALGGTWWWWLAVAAVTVFAIWRDLQSRKGT